MRESAETISTSRLCCSVAAAWEKVCFYEHIVLQPSWLLRSVLPVPVKTTGAYRNVGDTSRCMYSDGGYLTKRITHLGPGARVDFEIIEQSIRYSGWIGLKGGTIQIVGHTDGTCTVHMMTRYELPAWAYAAARFCVDLVVKAMHDVVIRDMRQRLAAPETVGDHSSGAALEIKRGALQ